MDREDTPQANALLERIAAALERLAPVPPPPVDFAGAMLHRFDAPTQSFAPAADFPLSLDLLLGVDAQKARLLETLRRFTEGLPALFEHTRVHVEVVEADDFDTFASGKRRLIYVEPGVRG